MMRIFPRTTFLPETVLAFGLFYCGAITAAAAEPAHARPDLTGTVQDDRGIPISNAKVFIYTAAPKEGAGILCPSCYADCRKSAQTDASGRFKITSLDPSLLFRILAVANNFQPSFVGQVDPAVKPIGITLKPARTGIGAKQQAKGRVFGLKGTPVQGAVVSLRGVTRGSSTQYGGNETFDQVAVSDENGDFVITGGEEFDSISATVEAAGYAHGIIPRVPAGRSVTKIQLTQGASLTGRLMKGGRPLPGIEIGTCGANREAGSYVGDFTLATDKDGRFLFVNLPPNRDYFVYAKMESLGAAGAVPAKRIRITGDGTTVKVGDLNVIKGSTLAGQVRLSDGKPVPPKTRVLLSREEAWDSVQATVTGDGQFEIHGVPPDPVSLSVRVKGYRFSKSNWSLDRMNGSLKGILRGDKTNLVIELEPGTHRFSPGEYVDLAKESLKGAEPRDRAGDIRVTGVVTDARTGKPIESFTVTEGRVRDQGSDNVQWISARTTPGAGGKLDIFLAKAKTSPALMVEAEGYLPQTTPPLPGSTNIDFALQPGQGPSGVVLDTAGKPVAGAKVYMVDIRNSAHVSGSELRPSPYIGEPLRSTITDDQGKFKFPPRTDDFEVLLLEEEGFGEVRIEDLAEKPEVKLKPWGKVSGKLMIGARPGTKEIIRLFSVQLPNEFYPRTIPPLSLSLDTTTDESGEFTFERVPPINLKVYHAPRTRDEAAGPSPMSQTISLNLKPGEHKKLTLGGLGRPVIGRVLAKGYDKPINWRADAFTLDLVRTSTDQGMNSKDILEWVQMQVSRVRALGDEKEKARVAQDIAKKQRERASRAYSTAESRDAYFKESKRYALNFDQNGNFRIEDVPGGKYKLRIALHEQGQDGLHFRGNPIGNIDMEVDVPGAPGTRSDEPYDLGTIELRPARR
jgi:hypothetical protein